jgi:hypothetical protein
MQTKHKKCKGNLVGKLEVKRPLGRLGRRWGRKYSNGS